MGAVEILNLRQAFDERQSNAIAQFFDTNAASKRDIEGLRLEIEKVRGELKIEIEQLRSELKLDITEVRREIEQLSAETEKMRADLTGTILRVQVGGVISIGLIIALVRIVAP